MLKSSKEFILNL